jgi:beta-lactamase regulating signal transducer with metallopeptidase domain
MSRLALIVLASLSAYCLLNLAISFLVALIWRTRAVAPANLPPIVRARRLLQLRLVPSVAAAAITVLVVMPAFAIFEPSHAEEAIGPVFALLAALALCQLVVAAIVAARSVWLTRRVEREWLRTSQAIDARHSAGLRAFAIESSSPMVALVGVFAPKLIASTSVVNACSAEEIACIAGHERGHLDARDNIKRWIMASLPDMLRWTPVHREIVDAWHHAAEDAADDATTAGEAIARAELAALLLKVVRLAPAPVWNAAVVSPFVEQRGLERRVLRLLQPELEPPAPLAIVPLVTLVAVSVAMIAAMSSPAALERIFNTIEHLVAFGR